MSPLASYNPGLKVDRTEAFRSRTEAELAEMKDSTSGKGLGTEYSEVRNDEAFNSFRSRNDAELAALKELNVSMRDVAQSFNAGMKSDVSESFRSRTDAELASLKELKNSKTGLVQTRNTEVTSDGSEFFRSRNEAELQALKNLRISVKPLAPYNAGLHGESTESLKSPAEAELAALKERNVNLKDVAHAYDSGIKSDTSQPFRSRTEIELAALKEQIHANPLGVYTAGLKSDKSDSFRARTEAELAVLSKHAVSVTPEKTDNSTVAGHVRQADTKARIAALKLRNSEKAPDVAQISDLGTAPEGLKSQAVPELAALKKQSSSVRNVREEFISSPRAERFKSREASELEALRLARGSGSLRIVAGEFESGVSSPTSERFKSREAAELEVLRANGNSSLRNVAGELRSDQPTSSADRFKIQAAAELAALQSSSQAINSKRVAEQFNRGIASPKSDRFKSKTTAELAELAEQQRMKKEDEVALETAQVLVETTAKTAAKGLTDERLAKIAAEREAELLEMWNQRSSQEKLKQHKARTAAELRELGIGQEYK